MTDSILTLAPFTAHAAYTLWRKEGKLKVPVHYDGATHHSTANPAPALTAEQCEQWLAHHVAQGAAVGAGFRPAGTGLVCVDLDNCVGSDGWTPGALQLMARLPGALIEQSVSGRGAHIWCTVQGAGPGRRGKKTTPLGDIEVYGEGQFIAAGTVLGGSALVDHTAAIAQLVADYWPAVPESDAKPLPADLLERMPQVLADVRSALSVLDPDNRDEWVGVGQALYHLGEAGYEMWAEWSARSTRFPGGDGLDKWDSFSGQRSDYRAVLARAQRAGWVNPAQRPALPSDAAAVFAGAGAAVAPLPPGAVTTPPPGRSELSFMAAAQGAIAASLANVYGALRNPESGIRIAYDSFKDRVSIGTADEPWRPLKDTDYGRLRAAFEERGFKPVSAEAMSTAVAMVAETNTFDSLADWVNTLKWDGVKRMERLLPDYYGAEDTPYTRSVGPYMFTTLAGRALVPGVKADMAVIMVGLQGAYKTSSLEVLAPEPEAFGEVDLGKDDDVIARQLRGKSVIELAEMRGFKGRDADANKAWVSRRKEEWTPKYKEFTTTYWRRCLIIGTANDAEQLDDPTGARRFLPVHVAKVKLDELRRDMQQLWAEGVARFRDAGIAWQDAENLARAEHHKFEVVDEMQALVEQFMDSVPSFKPGEPVPTEKRSAQPIRGVDILTGCYGMAAGQIKKADQQSLAKIMKRLGYERSTKYHNGIVTKVWIRVGKTVGKS